MMITKRVILLSVLAFGVATGGFIGAGVLAQEGGLDVRGEPGLEVYSPDNVYSSGSVAELTVQIDNDGELSQGSESHREYVTTARNVVVKADDDETPIEVRTDKRAIGSVTEDEPGKAPVEIEIPDNTEPGVYEIDVRIEYTWTERTRDQSEGEIELRNERSRSTTQTVEIEIEDEANFRLEDVESTLHVGEEGEVTGNVTNVGQQDATNAEVQFPTESDTVVPLETAVSVGDIPAGESASFRIPIEATSEAEAVEKRFDLPVSYRDKNGIRTEDDDPEFVADIAPKRDEFSLTARNQNVTAGTSTELEIELTNTRNQTLTDIEAKLVADSPLDSDDNEAFVSALEPGESATVSLGLRASAGATAKSYPVTVDFRYDDAKGRSQLSDSYRLPIAVQPDESSVIPWWGFIIGLLILDAVGYAWYRRR